MFKHIKTIIVAAAAIFLCASCQDYLNMPPKGSLSPDGYYTTPSHAEQGVLGVYSVLRDIEWRQYILMSESRSDNVWVDPAPNGIRNCSEISYLRWNSNVQSDLDALWASWYSVIYNANMVLSNLDAITFSDEDVKDQFRGELLFLRGYAHFELARVFGNVPVVDHNLSSAEAKTLGQSSASEVINNSVIPDLKEAEELLPYEDGMKSASDAAVGGAGRADKLVVQAMLARVYMTLKGWPYNDASAKASAKSYLETVLKYSSQNGDKYWAPTIDDWKKIWLTDRETANKYTIFAIQHTQSTPCTLPFYTVGHTLTTYYLPNGSTYANGSEMNPLYVEATLRREYVNNNDLRGLDFTILDGYEAYGGTTTPYSNMETEFTLDDGTKEKLFEKSLTIKYFPYKDKRESVGINGFDDNTVSGGWPINFPVLRIEDMMLLYAELLVEDGNISDAMGYVNKIRDRAGVPVVSAGASSDEATEYIQRERKLELYMEGVRWFDQIRLGIWDSSTLAKFNRYINSSNGDYATQVGVENVKAGRYLSSIPQAEMLAVPGLYTQNEGWENY